MSERSKVNWEGWGQAFRIVIAATITVLVVALYTNEVSKGAFQSGVKVGYAQGAAQCYKPEGSRFENTSFRYRDRTP